MIVLHTKMSLQLIFYDVHLGSVPLLLIVMKRIYIYYNRSMKVIQKVNLHSFFRNHVDSCTYYYFYMYM